MADDRDPAAAAAYVRQWAPSAGYDLDAFGESARLADAAGVPRSTVSRLVNAVRVPDAPSLFLIAEALGRPPLELLVASGTIPNRFLDQQARTRVASRPVTADDLADQWGANTPEERAAVRDAVESARRLFQSSRRGGAQETGS